MASGGASDDSLKPGVPVFLEGLVKAPHRNGATGVLVSLDGDRWIVRLVSGEDFRVLPKNIRLDGLAAMRQAAKTAAAARASTASSDCVVCLDPLKGAAQTMLSCGHGLHVSCWKDTKRTMLDTRKAAHCPLCNAWQAGESDIAPCAWFERPAMELLIQMLGFVFQSRWQAEGRDRSAKEEMAFIAARIQHVKSKSKVGFEALFVLEKILAKDRVSVLRPAAALGARGCPMTPELNKELELLFQLITATFSTFLLLPREDGAPASVLNDDQAYMSHLSKWLATIGRIVGEVHKG